MHRTSLKRRYNKIIPLKELHLHVSKGGGTRHELKGLSNKTSTTAQDEKREPGITAGEAPVINTKQNQANDASSTGSGIGKLDSNDQEVSIALIQSILKAPVGPSMAPRWLRNEPGNDGSDDKERPSEPPLKPKQVKAVLKSGEVAQSVRSAMPEPPGVLDICIMMLKRAGAPSKRLVLDADNSPNQIEWSQMTTKGLETPHISTKSSPPSNIGTDFSPPCASSSPPRPSQRGQLGLHPAPSEPVNADPNGLPEGTMKDFPAPGIASYACPYPCRAIRYLEEMLPATPATHPREERNAIETSQK